MLIGRQKTTYRTFQPRLLVDVPQRTGIVQRSTPLNAVVGPDELTPSLYILNAAALSKPGAIDHLTVDLKSYGISVAIVTETHFKTKHKDSIVSVDGYTVFRRDRVGRRGGGVAVYVTSALQSSRWTPSVAGLATLEVDWVRVGDRMLIAALYHPPRPIYKPEELLDYVDACVSEISHDFPLADIVIAGDVNQLSDRDVVERTGLTQIVHQPTRGTNILDRIYVSSPDLYRTVRVVKSVVRSDHKAVVAFADKAPSQQKTVVQRQYRTHTPAQHAQFLQHAVSIDFTNPHPSASSDPAINTQTEFDHFYSIAHSLLDHFYPEHTVTMASRDPAYITPQMKAMLRRKNRLMRAGRVEEAGALSARIGREIQSRSRTQLTKFDGRTDVKRMWIAVRQLTGRQQAVASVVDGVTAETLNEHYVAISTDQQYAAPTPKQLARQPKSDSHWTRRPTGLVPLCSCPDILQTRCLSIQHIARYINGRTTVEGSQHHTSA